MRLAAVSAGFAGNSWWSQGRERGTLKREGNWGREREMEAAAVAKVFLPGPFHLEAAGPFRGRGFCALPSQRLLGSP